MLSRATPHPTTITTAVACSARPFHHVPTLLKQFQCFHELPAETLQEKLNRAKMIYKVRRS